MRASRGSGAASGAASSSLEAGSLAWALGLGFLQLVEMHEG